MHRLFAVICLWLATIVARADLPILLGDEWVGCFAVHEGRRYDFTMQAQGQMTLCPKRRGGDAVAALNQLGIRCGIEEVMPDGKVVFKETRDGSLTSEQEATRKLSRQVIRGETTGDAVFELVVEQSRDVISIGGRVVDVGKLKKYPLRFTVRVAIPDVYRSMETVDKEQRRVFKRLAHGDYLQIRRVDGSRLKLTHADSAALDVPQVNGAGIEEIEMRLSYYDGRQFYFAASKDSGIALSAADDESPWYGGMTLHWWPDAEKNSQGSARLSLCVR